MFEHSVKVPRLYKSAAKIVKAYKENGINVRDFIFNNRHPNVKGLHALVSETIRKSNRIEYILCKSKLLKKEDRLDPCLASVLITELLWGKKVLPGNSKPVKTILAHEQTLKAHSSDYVEDKSSNPEVLRPRYVRINTLKLSTSEAVDAFRDEGWILKKFTNNDDIDGFLEAVSNLSVDEFMVDIHVKDLLIFPPGTEFFKHEAYLSGSIFLQEKASCIPVQVLDPPPGSIVLDMCAAPGNKTTQLAAILNDKGTIYAVDMDQKRAGVLETMVEKSGATCVKLINRDVVTITDKECPNVEYILVDPSCTGSGLTNRIKADDEEDVATPDRLKKLQGFQIKILKHALRNFPNAKRVVYSTCSQYKEENEEVVKEVLQSSRYFKLVHCENALMGKWSNYGSSEYGDIGRFSLYSKPEKDFTIGFFVAVFERLNEDEVNPYLKLSVSTTDDVAKREKKKKKKLAAGDDGTDQRTNDGDKKQERSHSQEVQHDDNNSNVIDQDEGTKKRKKKKGDGNLSTNVCDQIEEEVEPSSKRKRKKKAKSENDIVDVNVGDDTENTQVVKKSKKKKHKTKSHEM